MPRLPLADARWHLQDATLATRPPVSPGQERALQSTEHLEVDRDDEEEESRCVL